MTEAFRHRAAYRAKRLLMCLVRPVAPVLSDDILRRVPVVGVVPIALPGKKRILFYTDGYDYTTSFLFWKGAKGYEPGTIKLVFGLLRHIETFIDIGANTGLYSLLAAADGDNRRVYGFEPVPRIYSAFLRNIRLNGLENCFAYQIAVGDYDGVTDIFVPRGRIPTGATTNPERPTQKSAPTIIRVPAVRLDTFIAREGIRGVDLIKMDTETTEPKVMAGARQTIDRYRPAIICEVLPGLTENSIQQFMTRRREYRYFWIAADRLVERTEISGDEVNMNYLFIPEERIPAMLEDTDFEVVRNR